MLLMLPYLHYHRRGNCFRKRKMQRLALSQPSVKHEAGFKHGPDCLASELTVGSAVLYP